MVVAIVPSSLVAQRCTQIKGLEKSYPSLFIQPTRGNQVPSRGENERQREREVDTLRDAKDTERVGEREKITGSFVPFVRGCSFGRGWVGNGEDLSNRVAWRVYILRGCVPGAYATSPPKARRCNNAGHYY